jgi:S-DNA-T family DNA segregation ATPase FtsK/SpoIIIE
LHFYLLDFGTNGLLALRGLPHVADTLTIDDAAKALKFVARVDTEIKARKRLLSQHSVANLGMYERASGQILPAIVLILDGYEGFKGSPFDDALTALLHQVAREGAGLGIHLVMSAARQASLRSSLTANIKTQVALKLNDDSEARAIVGRTTITIDDCPGRGLIKLDQPELFQTALPAPGNDMLEVISAIQAEAMEMSEHWSGLRPARIPMVPDTLTVDDLAAWPGTADLLAVGTIPMGLEVDSVTPVGINPVTARQTLILCPDLDTVATIMAAMWTAGKATLDPKAFVLDDQSGQLSALAATIGSRGPDATSVTDMLASAIAELDERKAAYQVAKSLNAQLASAQYARGLQPALVFIADMSAVAQHVGRDGEKDLMRLASEGPTYGMPLVIGGTLATAGKAFDDFAKQAKLTTVGLVTGTYADQSLLKAANIGYREPALGKNEGYLIAGGQARRTRLPG